jgi:hypothetical protein
MAFHQHARGPLECLLLLQLRLDILGMVLVGPKRRQQLGEPPLCHLEDGQGLNEEVGCGLGDVLQLLGALVGLEDIQEDAVMDAGEIEDAELLDNRPPAELVGRPAAPFAALGKVLEKDGSVVAPEPLVGVAGHKAPGRSAAVIAGPAARSLPGAAAAGTPGPLPDRARCGRCPDPCPGAPARRRPTAGCRQSPFRRRAAGPHGRG